MFKKYSLFLMLATLLFCSCNEGAKNESKPEGGKKMGLNITSGAFANEAMIPSKYTCDGEDISPPLKWESAPERVKSFALISDDPDAPVGVWVHWVIYNIPADTHELQENFPLDAELDNGTKQGKNDFGKIGYGGPCPPGGTHRYYFKLYALDTVLDLQSGVTKADLLKAMEGHILEEAQLMGRYTRN